MDWGIPYIIEKLLECKCLKWARMTHLDIQNTSCHNPSLGLATKAKGVARLRAKRETRESLHMLPGVQRVWGHEPSHSQMNSHVGSWSPKWIPEFSECNCRGQISLPWNFFYIIGKLLKCRCLKWARITHLDIWNTSYGQKEGRESQFDSRPLKVGNRPNSLTCRQHATYRWKAFDDGYNFALNLIAIEGLHKKLCALKVAGVPVVGISGLPLASPGTKSHLDVTPVERRKVYYKGEGSGFLQVRALMSLVCPSCPWFVLAPKVLQLCTNHFVLVLCTSVWVSKACHFFLVPSQSSNMPLYPFIVLRARERAPIPYPSIVFNLGLTFESLKELRMRHKLWPTEGSIIKLTVWLPTTKNQESSRFLHV
jgi:hypothetical protein